jgi:hypothetical protein
MKSYCFALAALVAIGFSGAASAEEATKGSAAQTAGPAVMSDTEMDAVTAGSNPADPDGGDGPGAGVLTACDAQNALECATRAIPNGPNVERVIGIGRLSAPGQP